MDPDIEACAALFRLPDELAYLVPGRWILAAAEGALVLSVFALDNGAEEPPMLKGTLVLSTLDSKTGAEEAAPLDIRFVLSRPFGSTATLDPEEMRDREGFWDEDRVDEPGLGLELD